MAEEQRELTALVVDDDEPVRDILVDILSGVPNLRIETATNGEEAYGKIKVEKPDILYTDVIMPRMRGDQFLEKLVADGIKIPTFVITGTAVTEEGARAISYSHEMYTKEQQERLNLPIQASGEAKADPGFTGITKPFKIKEVRDRTNVVMQLVYNIIQS